MSMALSALFWFRICASRDEEEDIYGKPAEIWTYRAEGETEMQDVHDKENTGAKSAWVAVPL